MNYRTRPLVVLMLLLTRCPLFSSPLNDRIKIVCTSAQKVLNYEERKREYIHALSLLRDKHGFDFYLVEAIAAGPTYLNEYCNHVCYTRSNKAWLANYGVNEAVSLRIALRKFKFDPDTIIIKLTGRYTLEEDEFVRLVEQNLDADVIARIWDDGAVCTGLFAMRLKYLMDCLDNLPYQEMIKRFTPIEYAIGRYVAKIKKEGAKIVPLEKMYKYIYVPAMFPQD